MCYNHYPDEKGTERSIPEMISVIQIAVTTITPMKRGLKVRANPSRLSRANDVTTIAPMKRGLKEGVSGDIVTSKVVTTIAPMKRGLKGLLTTSLSAECLMLQPLPR